MQAPEEPADPRRLAGVFERFGLPASLPASLPQRG